MKQYLILVMLLLILPTIYAFDCCVLGIDHTYYKLDLTDLSSVGYNSALLCERLQTTSIFEHSHFYQDTSCESIGESTYRELGWYEQIPEFGTIAALLALAGAATAYFVMKK